ncbi:UNKNOWN [Stylonychia lemnae]|uniref:Uncharacterized protein n=1 Tax=Stylonychia lemnae TaxID=5949 RepID=A0A078AEM9_STYLE|nr:UNKNOWN [Stylonychia lemnae]|eukprot:CDW79932.1 UNKNOWN [Stylonychia lemnae]
MYQITIDTKTFDQITDQVLKPQTKILDNKQYYDEMPLENYLDKQYGFTVLNSNVQQHDDDSPQNVNHQDQNPNVQEDQLQINSNNSQEYYKMFGNSQNQDASNKNNLLKNDNDDTLTSISKFTNEYINLNKSQKLLEVNQHENQNDHLKSLDQSLANTLSRKNTFQDLIAKNPLSYLRIKKKFTQNQQKERMFVIKLFQSSLGFEENQNDDPALSQNQLFNELVFFLGSVFYPNKMIRLIDDESGKKIIKLIDVSIHQFTYQRLCFLCQWDAFKHIFQHYLDASSHKQNKKSKHMASSNENFEKSINFLKGMIFR